MIARCTSECHLMCRKDWVSITKGRYLQIAVVSHLKFSILENFKREAMQGNSKSILNRVWEENF